MGCATESQLILFNRLGVDGFRLARRYHPDRGNSKSHEPRVSEPVPERRHPSPGCGSRRRMATRDHVRSGGEMLSRRGIGRRGSGSARVRACICSPPRTRPISKT